MIVLIYLFFALTVWIIAFATLSRKLERFDLRLVDEALAVRENILVTTFYKIRPDLQLLFIFCSAALLMTAYESVKEFIFRGSLTPWESHIYTIVMAATFATGASLFMRKLLIKLNAQLNIAAVAFESQESIIVTDVNNTILRVNNAFTNITGYTAEEVIGKHTRILNSGNHDANFYVAMWESITNTNAWKGEVQNRRKNGEIYHALLNITAVKDQNDITAYYVGSLTDITDLKLATDNLLENERHFRAINKSATDAIISSNSAGNIMGWNPAAERLFGYTEAEINGQPITVLMPERFRKRHSEGIASMVAGETLRLKGNAIEVFGLRKDGTEFPLELSLAQWRAADGQFFTAIIRDITERQKVELELFKANVLLTSIVDNIPLWIFWKDRESRFLGCNKLFLKNVGLANLDEFVGKTDFDMAWKGQAELYRSDDKVVMDSGIPKLGYEEQLATPDGNFIWVRTFKVPLHSADGKVVGIVSLCEDITKSKLKESQLLEQLDELRRWQNVMSSREERILGLKHEVNELLDEAGQPPRYSSAEAQNQTEK